MMLGFPMHVMIFELFALRSNGDVVGTTFLVYLLIHSLLANSTSKTRSLLASGCDIVIETPVLRHLYGKHPVGQ